MRTLLLTIIAIFSMYGCAQKEGAMQTKEHLISPASQTSKEVKKSPTKTLKIKLLNSSSLYARDDMWYKTGSEFTAFAKNRWAMSPNEQVQRLFSSTIQSNSVSFTPIAESSSVNADYTLEVSINSFYQEFVANESFVVVSINTSLLSNKTYKLIESKKYDFRQKCKTNDPAGAIDAYNEVFTRLQKTIEL